MSNNYTNLSAEEKKSLIKTIVTQNPEPDENIVPFFLLRWNGKNKDGEWARVYNSKTQTVKEHEALSNAGYRYSNNYHEIQNEEAKNDKRFIRAYAPFSVSSGIFCVPYCKTHEINGTKILELSQIVTHKKRRKAGEKAVWSWDNFNGHHLRFFLFKNDFEPYLENGEKAFRCNVYTKRNTHFTRFMTHTTENKARETCLNMATEFAKFTGLTQYRNSWSNQPYCSWYTWADWYQKAYPNVAVTENKVTKKTSELKEMTSEEIEALVNGQTINLSSKYTYQQSKGFWYFQKINEDYAIIRGFMTHYTHGWFEKCRVFVSSTGKPTVMARIYSDHDFHIVTTPPSTNMAYGDYPFINLKDISEWPRLKYIEPILPAFKNKVVDGIVTILRHPFYELFYKSGYTNIFKVMYGRGIKESLALFGLTKEKAHMKLGDFGVSKHFLKAFDEKLEDYDGYQNAGVFRALDFFRAKYGESLRGWDYQKSIQQFEGAIFLFATTYRWDIEFSSRNSYRPTVESREQALSIIPHMINMCIKDSAFAPLFKDTLQTWKNIPHEHRPDVFDRITKENNLQELQRLHDSLTELYNQTRPRYTYGSYTDNSEEVNKSFEKLQKERKEKFNFSDDEYEVRVPENLEEIRKEGVDLSHCVGGYTTRHGLGFTNIMFLRKATDPDKAFYTMEVSNTNEVVQIHGAHNKWLGNDAEAIPFVIKWLTAKSIHCMTDIILCKSTGYARGTTKLDGKKYGLTESYI